MSKIEQGMSNGQVREGERCERSTLNAQRSTLNSQVGENAERGTPNAEPSCADVTECRR
jgi:hypothetical protein